jgi:hypothetical protein
MADLIGGVNFMDALNSVAVALSGLVFAGTAALTVGAAIPASAQAVVSMPYQGNEDLALSPSYDDDKKRIEKQRISQRCVDTENCNPQVQQTVGDDDRPRQSSERGEDGNDD